MSLSTPVALIIFNRPVVTQVVFDAIRKAKPQKLLIIADGPRLGKPGESEKCQAARAIVEHVDWDCEVLKNYSELNLGCKKRVSSGLDWVFSEVTEAIILEDDCLPDPSFFGFCETLLEHYRYDERIMMIGGSNFQQGISRTNYSYYFSKYTHIWGWATWRRAWQHYDVDINSWNDLKGSGLLSSLCEDSYEQQYWADIFDRVALGMIDTWDYQWLYTSWCQGSLSIIPNTNLVSNLGFGIEATHTFGDSPFANLPTNNIQNIKHPHFVIRNREADNYTLDYHFGIKGIRDANTVYGTLQSYVARAKQRVKKIIVEK